MKQTLKKFFIGVFLLLWQFNAQAADMGTMMAVNQEAQTPTVSASAASEQTTPQTKSVSSIPPAPSLGGTEVSLTPSQPENSPVAAMGSAATSTTASTQTAKKDDQAAGSTAVPGSTAPAPEKTPKTTLIDEGDLPPEIINEHQIWMEDPYIKNLIDEVKYCKNKQDCDDFAQQMHVYLTMLGIESYQVVISPGSPKPPTDGTYPPLVFNPKPAVGHAVITTVTEIDGKTYMCMYEPQTGERYGCAEVPDGNMGKRNEVIHELSKVWMEENYPNLTHTVTSTNGTHNVDPGDGLPPYLDPNTKINLEDPAGRNIDNLRRCFYILQQDGSSKLVCTEGN